MQSINLVNCIMRGLEELEDASPVSYHGWAMNHLNIPNDWSEDRIHVSDYSTQLTGHDRVCPRQLWLRYHGADKKQPKLGEKIMWDQGRSMQYRYTWTLQHGLPEEYKLLGVEYDVSEGLPRNDTGHADIVLAGEESNLVIEVKTQRGRAFRYLDEPKRSHVMQLAGYVYALNNMMEKSVYGTILYLDREGQNKPLQFEPVLPELSEIPVISNSTRQIATRSEAPDLLEPEVKINENKGANSIKLKLPWQCSYCSYDQISCPGALDPELRDQGVVAKVQDSQPYNFKNEKAEKIIKEIYSEV